MAGPGAAAGAAAAEPAADAVLEAGAAFGGAADLARLRLPDAIVLVVGADDGVGDLLQQGVDDLVPGSSEGVADGHRDGLVAVAAQGGAAGGGLEAEAPAWRESAQELVGVQEAVGAVLDLGEGGPAQESGHTTSTWKRVSSSGVSGRLVWNSPWGRVDWGSFGKA